jgi:predicted GNAT family N-acyltransferase
MEQIEYHIIGNNGITDEVAGAFVALLKKQNKVKNPNVERIKTCKLLCVCKCDGAIVAIGAIKQKTESDFLSEKSDLPTLKSDFSWELGYCFTEEEWRGKGISTSIVKLLLREVGNENLMASTEMHPTNPMIRILTSNGFSVHGKPWRSSIHNGFLGLFLRFKEGETAE